MSIDAKLYEFFVKGFYERLLSEGHSKGTQLKHRQRYTGLSGQSYEIDLSYEFVVGDALRFLVLFECKAYLRRVKVNDVLEFAQKLSDINANKGIVVTTVGYERGAYRVAKANRIALAILDRESRLGRALMIPEDLQSARYQSKLDSLLNPLPFDRLFEDLRRKAPVVDEKRAARFASSIEAWQLTFVGHRDRLLARIAARIWSNFGGWFANEMKTIAVVILDDSALHFSVDSVLSREAPP